MTYTLKTDLTLRGRYLTQTQAEYHSIGQSQSNLIKTTYVTSNVQVTKGLVTQLLIEPNAGNRAVFPTEYLFEAVAEAKRPCPHAPHQGNVSTSPRFLWHLFTVSVPITHLVYDLILYMPACPCSSSRSAPARRSVRFMPSCCITHARLFVQLLLVVPSGSCRLSLRVMPVFPSGSCSSCCPAPARRLVRFIPSTYLPGSCPCIYPASFEGNSPLLPSPAHAEFPLPLSSGLLNSLDRFSASSVLHPPQLAASKTRLPTARPSSRASRRRQSHLHSTSSPGQYHLSLPVCLYLFPLRINQLPARSASPTSFPLSQATTPREPTDRVPPTTSPAN